MRSARIISLRARTTDAPPEEENGKPETGNQK
jgi:hypothetical protein